MARTIVLYVAPAAVIAWQWLRLEERTAVGQVALLAALALAPALVRGLRARVAVALLASVLAAASAFELSLAQVFSGKAAGRFSDGFLSFYDFRLPFDPVRHPRMHGVVLLALFVSCLGVALAIASRRAIPAALVLLVGAGWPATLLPGDDLLRGAILLAVVLTLVYALRAGERRLVPAAFAGAAVVGLAAALASSSAIAGGSVLDWQNWDPYTKGQAPVGVRYVWDSNFRGIRFPKRRTTVLRVKASRRANYWRATALDQFDGVRWKESLVPLRPAFGPGRDELTNDVMVAPSAYDPRQWAEQEVTVVGLRDEHLVGASIPIAFSSNVVVGYAEGGIATANGFLPRASRYLVWSNQPRPTPTALARSRPLYPPQAERDLELFPGVAAPSFGTPGRAHAVHRLFATDSAVAAYRGLYRTAVKVVGNPRTPYGAAVGLEAWFRSGGGFRYDTQPPPVRGLPLAAFVTTARRGYCQHFAGAMALMLRYLGVPARVAAGFTSGRYNHRRGEWIVTDHDAHTWVEAWFEGYGWLPFDPTPRRGTLTGSYTSASPTFDAGGALLALAAGAAGVRGASVLERLRRRSGEALNGRSPNLRGQRSASARQASEGSRWPLAGV
ncbi:MAG: DUF3488 and transglutaminase-like domain-containing protein, partial [Actinomycetota bacterium]|nr:DUF3488 and transglutaminase-like domain-containing protein [Actinomycetota bacterium]